MCCERWSNEAATVHADITADHRDIPAELWCLRTSSTCRDLSIRLRELWSFLGTFGALRRSYLGRPVASGIQFSTHFLSASLLVRAQNVPEECHLWPRRTGVCLLFPLLLETHVPTAGGVGLSQSHLPKLDEFLRTSRQPSGTP